MNILDSLLKQANIDEILLNNFLIMNSENLDIELFTRDQIDYIYLQDKKVVLNCKDVFLVNQSIDNINSFEQNAEIIDSERFDYIDKLNAVFPYVVVMENKKVVGILDLSLYRHYQAIFSREIHAIVRDILNTSHDAICVVNDEKKVLLWNYSATKMYGIEENEMIGNSINDMFPKALLPHVIDYQKAYENVFNNPREDFKNILTARPLYLNGMMIGGVSCDKDISDLEKENSVSKNIKRDYETKNIYTNTFDKIIGEDLRFAEIIELSKKISDSNINVLITGESGTGKEIFAQAIHNESKREGNFVPVNCSAIPKDLMESELFGYEKGSFTGALSEGKTGKFEQANNGTILLDEIGDLPLSMQPKILRILEDGIFYRIGGSIPIKVDVRVIASTNRDLKVMIEQKLFRKDLYYRLNSVHIDLPPLRERKRDIPLLINKFVKDFSFVYKMNVFEIEDEVMKQLINYPWEGNIRELRNIIERYIIMKKNGITDLGLPIFGPPILEEENIDEDDFNLNEKMIKLEKNLVIRALKATNFNQSKAAKLLKVPRTTLIYKMEKFNIKVGI
ncbi:MAG: sigma 54-interacting transcriptional regulator [Clostridiales bacterium]|nr:sigma 54-interacting transcriptional regulator [Clostridiales bacterium]